MPLIGAIGIASVTPRNDCPNCTTLGDVATFSGSVGYSVQSENQIVADSAPINSNPTRIVPAHSAAPARIETNGPCAVNITPNTTLAAYAPDAAVWGDEYISEKVETKAGWQFPSPDEDWMRGYPQELADFVDAIRERREPLSGGLLAREVVEVIYAGYLSAASGRRRRAP